MPVSIATFQSDLEKLIRKFEADQQHYASKDYLEAQAHMDLITPFFKALGWDVEVDYIVRETVGKAIEGKSPKQIEKIRILDPACGSGSFLIGAFQYLIDYHVKWYLAGGAYIAVDVCDQSMARRHAEVTRT